MHRTSLMIRIAAVAILLLLPATIMGYDFAVDGIYYNIKDGQAIVTNGGWTYCYNGNITIPDHVIKDGMTYPVVAIDNSTFIHCAITKVSIPNSVTAIAAEAF